MQRAWQNIASLRHSSGPASGCAFTACVSYPTGSGHYYVMAPPRRTFKDALELFPVNRRRIDSLAATAALRCAMTSSSFSSSARAASATALLTKSSASRYACARASSPAICLSKTSRCTCMSRTGHTRSKWPRTAPCPMSSRNTYTMGSCAPGGRTAPWKRACCPQCVVTTRFSRATLALSKRSEVMR